MKGLLFLLFLLFFFNLSIAQTPGQDPFATARDVMDKQPENYLAPLKAIKNLKIDSADFSSLNMWQQAMMTYYSFLGDYKDLLFYSDSRYKYNTQKVVYDTAFVKGHEFVNAADYISAQAGLHQVTMINEAHHLPFHRAFVLPMLKSFYKAGYRYLAIETLNNPPNKDTLINQKKYPDYNTGYYTVEPLFAEMLREAIKLNFKLIAYEANKRCDHKSSDPGYCQRFRDSLMAISLTAIIKSDPKAKILVYAGYAHINERTDNSWKKMAQYFREFTGIDPFTVDLTKQIEHLYPQYEEKEFIAVNKFKPIQQPVIAMKANRPWHGEFVDATVIFPVYSVKGKRPSFYSINGSRKVYNLNNLHFKPGQLVQAFYSNETPSNRIPADQLVIGNDSNSLYLFKGKYILAIKSSDGLLIKEYIINVD